MAACLDLAEHVERGHGPGVDDIALAERAQETAPVSRSIKGSCRSLYSTLAT